MISGSLRKPIPQAKGTSVTIRELSIAPMTPGTVELGFLLSGS